MAFAIAVRAEGSRESFLFRLVLAGEFHMSQYNPRTVLRQTSNALLREFFESKGHRLDVEWENLRETQVDDVYEAFLALPDGERLELEVDLHDVHETAQSEDGPRILVEEATYKGLRYFA